MLFSILALMALVISLCVKNRENALYVQSLSCMFEAIYSFLIGAFTGAILNIINSIRSFIYIHAESIGKRLYVLILILFECIIIMNCVYTWGGLISLVPTLGSVIRTYCLWQSDMRLVRFSGITTGIAYGLYYTYYHSWFLVFGYMVVLLTGVFSIYKNDIKNSKAVDKINVASAC